MRPNTFVIAALVGVACAGCGGGSVSDGPPPTAGVHPAGYSDPASPAFHGPEARRDPGCRACHGEDLTGGTSTVSCEQCHQGWQTNCTFCHGGDSDRTGAPPRDTNGVSGFAAMTVGAHTAHVAGRLRISGPIDCSICHLQPAGALDPGHIDGDHAEVIFSARTSDGWDRATGACGVYCHGAFEGGAQQNRPIWNLTGGEGAACGSCHARPPATGRHLSHVTLHGAACVDCHVDSDADATRILDPAAHVNGLRDVQFNRGGTWDAPRRACLDTCHTGTRHWTGPNAGVHPPGYAERGNTSFHGDDADRGLAQCQTCHGADLRGGTAGVSCEQCHAGWQTRCTHCHGTAADPSGSPPADVAGATATSAKGVGAHASHVRAAHAVASPLACQSCHPARTSALDPGHVAGTRAIISFVNPASAGWNPNSGTCAVYCHGQFEGGASANLPAWTSVGTGGADCGSCHGLPPATGRHASHVGRGDDCRACHPDATRTAITAPAQHVDGREQVAFAGGGTWDAAAGTCSNNAAGCHTNTRTWTGAGGNHPPGYGTAGNVPFHGDDALKGLGSCATSSCHGTDLLGGAAGVSCEQCHAGWQTRCTHCHGGTDNASGAPPRAVDGATATSALRVGTHTAHVAGRLKIAAGVSCTDCHPSRGGALEAGHLDGVVQLAMSGAAPGFSEATGTCGVYCHGNFPGGTATNRPSWTAAGGTQASCGTCHPMRPTTGQHLQHATEGVRCTACHNHASDAGDAIVNPLPHVDGKKDFTPSWGGSMTGGACSVWCHGAFPGGTASNQPSWTSGGAQACGACHPRAPTSGKHTQHAQDGFACNACHPDVDAGGSAITQPALHVNGAKDLALRWGGTFSGGTCAAYCHGNFSGGRTTNRPNWTSGPVQTCTSCHGNPPSTGSHSDHTRYTCSRCHPSFDANGAETSPDLHPNNVREVAASLGWSAGTRRCSTAGCHGVETW